MALIDVIKYEGNNSTLIFKHPIEDFNRKAQLIVHDSQRAYVLCDGKGMQLYTSGKHILESKNLPGVKHVIGVFTGGELQNHCEVYFVNMATALNVGWETTPMDIQDVTLKVPYSFTANGSISVKVDNPETLLQKVVGTTNTFSVAQFQQLFGNHIVTVAKEVISQSMVNAEYSYYEINSHLKPLAEKIRKNVASRIREYGREISELFIDSVSILKDAFYDKQREHMLNREGRKIEGIDITADRAFNILEKQAENQGPAGVTAGIGVGAGFGIGAGYAMGGMMNDAMRQVGYGAPGVSAGPIQQMRQIPQDENYGVVKPKPIEDALEPKKQTGHICANCGELNMAENAAFCCFCGTKLSKRLTCAECGYELTEEMKFCPGCGKQQGR